MAFRKGDLIHLCVLVWVFRLFVDVCYIFFLVMWTNLNCLKALQCLCVQTLTFYNTLIACRGKKKSKKSKLENPGALLWCVWLKSLLRVVIWCEFYFLFDPENVLAFFSPWGPSVYPPSPSLPHLPPRCLCPSPHVSATTKHPATRPNRDGSPGPDTAGAASSAAAVCG